MPTRDGTCSLSDDKQCLVVWFEQPIKNAENSFQLGSWLTAENFMLLLWRTSAPPLLHLWPHWLLHQHFLLAPMKEFGSSCIILRWIMFIWQTIKLAATEDLFLSMMSEDLCFFCSISPFHVHPTHLWLTGRHAWGLVEAKHMIRVTQMCSCRWVEFGSVNVSSCQPLIVANQANVTSPCSNLATHIGWNWDLANEPKMSHSAN